MKKLLITVLCMALIFVLGACSQATEKETTKSEGNKDLWY